MFKKYTPWIVLGILVIGLVVIGIKACNDIPDDSPYELRINELKKELYLEKSKSDNISKEVKKWEKLYLEESKKPKKIIKITNEKSDSIVSLPFDSSVSFFNIWTNQPVPQIPE